MRRSSHLIRSRGLAQSNGPKKGDVSGSGEVSAYDASLVAQHVEGKTTLSAAQKERADVDGDGKVTKNDADLILNYAVGNIDSFPTFGNGGGGSDGGNGSADGSGSGGGNGSADGSGSGGGDGSGGENGVQRGAGVPSSTLLIAGGVAAAGIVALVASS